MAHRYETHCGAHSCPVNIVTTQGMSFLKVLSGICQLAGGVLETPGNCHSVVIQEEFYRAAAMDQDKHFTEQQLQSRINSMRTKDTSSKRVKGSWL